MDPDFTDPSVYEMPRRGVRQPQQPTRQLTSTRDNQARKTQRPPHQKVNSIQQPTNLVAIGVNKNNIQKQKKQFKIVAVIVGLLLIASTVVAGYCYYIYTNNRKPETISNKFVEFVKNKDAEKAYAMTNQDFRDDASIERLKEVVDQINPYISHQTKIIDRHAYTSDDNKAREAFVYVNTDSQKLNYLKIILTRSDNDVWQVYNLESSDKPLKANIE